MDVPTLLERINHKHGTDFRLGERYATGENHGAYAVEDGAGTPFVLKWQPQPDIIARLGRAREVTARLRALNVPVPRYSLIGTLPGGPAYRVQTALPGRPPERLDRRQLEQLLVWNDCQAGQAVSPEQNWSWYVGAVVFAGESGWTASLGAHSPETRALLRDLERVAAGKEARLTRTTDLVHGDLGPYNTLVADGAVTGVVDWDAAGCGDRALDLSKLLFYEYETQLVREVLRARIVDLSGPDALVVYMVYNVLAQLDWSIHHHSRVAVAGWVAKASAILDDLTV